MGSSGNPHGLHQEPVLTMVTQGLGRTQHLALGEKWVRVLESTLL